MPTLTIDGQTLPVPEGSTVLEAIRQAGVHLPTLCYWEGLPPYGACRLCLVELVESHSRQVVAACAYPAAEGLEIDTRGSRAVAVRRMMLEFMLARCPTSAVIRALATEAGLAESRFTTNAAEGELCILCGLCVRICRDLVGATAIGFIGRGALREVGTPFHIQAEACIGCGACAAVCPTGAVRIEPVDGQLSLVTWNTTLPLRPCPECGQPFAPESMSFLHALAGVGDRPWGLCEPCRRKLATRQMLAARQAVA
jgi:bidirectional [NiFe] hydrogenase diaphorase subunit